MQAYETPADRWRFLAPWTALLREHEIRIKTKYENGHSYRSEFESIKLTMQDSVMEDTASGETLRQTAGAIELVATALARFPDAWRTILFDQCGCKEYFNPNDEPLVPQFELDCGFYPGEYLVNMSGLWFFEVLMDQTARTPAFHEAMIQIERLSRLAGGAAMLRGLSVVGVKVCLGSYNEVDDVLVDFLTFVRALKQSQAYYDDRAHATWCRLETIDFDLTGVELTSEIIQRAIELVNEAPLVHITRVTIDPKEVQCSYDEMRELIRSLLAAYPKLEVELGDIQWGYEREFDADGSDSSSDPKIALVMQALAETRAGIKSINVGQLMTRARDERDRRQVVWGHLFGSLLAPTAACQIHTLELISPRILHVERDAEFIREAASNAPDYRMPQRLAVGVRSANQASLHAIIAALGRGVRHLSIVDDRQPIASATVAFILRTCPQLESLDLINVELESMDMFYLDSHHGLSALALTNVTLRDPPSLQTFLKQLADPQSFVGRTLREFSLVRSGDPDEVWDKLVLGGPAFAPQIKEILRANGRFHTLRLDATDFTPKRVMRDLMQEHRRPSAVQQSPLAMRSKLAFLSAMGHSSFDQRQELSHDVVRHIFDYAAVNLPRWISVSTSFYEDDEDDEEV